MSLCCAGKESGLTWEKRVKILRDCALALRYLHHFIDGCIVHRDIKVRIIYVRNIIKIMSDYPDLKILPKSIFFINMKEQYDQWILINELIIN